MSAFEKFQKYLITTLIALAFFYGGYYFGQRGYALQIKKNPPEITVLNKTPSDQTIDFEQFWKVWELVSTEHLERPVDSQALLYGAIQGMVEAIGDPYTSYLPPVLNELFDNNLSGTYEGIGAQLGMEEGQVIVISPFDGSPAKRSGLRIQDRILGIDGESAIGSTLSEAVAKIRGPAGTVVKLTVRNGEEPNREIAITRGAISVPSVNWEDKGEGVAYIRVSRFGPGTSDAWDEVVQEINLQMTELDSVIVDVRSNPGGYLSAAVHLAEEFFTKDVVLYRENVTGDQMPIDAKRRGLFTKVPGVFVLIDEGSASASEILAGALRDQVDAVLIGKKSFGKGTIQSVQTFDDSSALHLTQEKWLTPSKVWVHENGMIPDVEVELDTSELENNTDTQLEKAIELAKQI